MLLNFYVGTTCYAMLLLSTTKWMRPGFVILDTILHSRYVIRTSFTCSMLLVVGSTSLMQSDDIIPY